MRFLLLLLILPGCTLITDFDRERSVVLEITGDIPPPQFTTPLNQRRDLCVSACSLGRSCLYDPEITQDCAHAPVGASYQTSNDDILLHNCIGLCVEAADEILAAGGADLATCEDLADKPGLKLLAQITFCTGDVSLCDRFLCAQVGNSTVLETCIGIDLEGTCVPNCEVLPEAYWACAFEDTAFQTRQFEEANPDLSEEEKGDQQGQYLCQALGRCAGLPPRPAEGD